VRSGPQAEQRNPVRDKFGPASLPDYRAAIILRDIRAVDPEAAGITGVSEAASRAAAGPA
jgi:hypothetical protein